MTSEWFYSPELKETCKVIESQTLWGEMVYRVWFPRTNSVLSLPASKLKPLEFSNTDSLNLIAYISAAARVLDTLTQDLMVAPIEATVIPLPHQIKALSKAISNDRVRYLLADEVGLGKTIEAGLIMRELKLRGLVKRTLVVTPRGLVTQWISELRTHFNEELRLLDPGDFKAYRNILKKDNVWREFDQVICPVDSVKPLDGRQGWSADKVAEYNRERYEDLLSAGWDLIIVDEAHRLGGSTEQVARYRLGLGLADAAPYLLLLTATPHQGKSDAFHRLIALLDSEQFPDMASVSKERVQPYVIRTEKRKAINADGKPLFKPRLTKLLPVSWGDKHLEQRLLYDAVTEYVRTGYNQALKEKRNYIGFLMILMQRLVTSSIRAIRATLERRLEVLKLPEQQLTLFSLSEDDWSELDSQEQFDVLLNSRLGAMDNEKDEIRILLNAAQRCEESGPDVKAEALLENIYRLQREESDPDLKVLIFTEFVPTQDMLIEFLGSRGFSTERLNGSMDMKERERAQSSFAKDTQILISTDAGGEGLNLQFCHIVINYDIPWNPMKLEQRIGRVDRIGQDKVVRAINFVFEDTVEFRVREVLEEKLAVICEEFGIDKTGDVLDSTQAGKIFDELYLKTIINPDELDENVGVVVGQIKEQIEVVQENKSLLGEAEDLDPSVARNLLTHPLPYWIERMTLSYLDAMGGQGKKNKTSWEITWPDGEVIEAGVFTLKDAHISPTAKHLTLENKKIRSLAVDLPLFVPGQPIPVLQLDSLQIEIQGFWSLWRIKLSSGDWEKQRMLPIFYHDDGRCLTPTARFIWDQLLTSEANITSSISGDDAKALYDRLQSGAEEQGKPIYQELLRAHNMRVEKEKSKWEYAFSSRRRAIDRLGLPEVRNHRLSQLAQEEHAWREQIHNLDVTRPELEPILIMRVEGGSSGG